MKYFNKYLFTTILLSFSLVLSAQTLERSVVCSDGDYVTTSSISLEYTIGETAIGHFSNSSLTLSQGFNQADTSSKNISIKEETIVSILDIYPNPTNDNLFITSMTLGSIEVIDATGKTLLENISCSPSVQVKLDVTKLTAGVYFLVFKGQNGNSTQRWVKE